MNKKFFHICNPNTPEPSGCSNIYSKKELLGNKEEENACFLLNIHLTWDNRNLSADYGFDIANYIRSFKKSLLPIIFYSPIQKEYFELKSKKSLKYKLLFGRGSTFIEAPFSETQLTKIVNNVPPLSESSLHDVVTMLADVKGVVLDKLNHNLKFGSEILLHFGEVEPYLTEKQKALVDFEEYRQKLIGFSDEDSFYDAKEAFLGICNIRLTEKGKDVVELPARKYKILVVEDVKTELEKATKHLEKFFEVVSVVNSVEAIRILKEDLSNEILAVVSDWRLYTDDSQTYWQKYQGYEVLEAASKTGIRTLFALTSQADFVVHHIRNAMSFKFSLLKKQNLRNSEQWFLFSDLLYASCTDVLSTFSEMPSSANWEKNVNGISYKELYFQKKQSLESKDFFISVSDKADEVWGYIIKQSETGYKDLRLIKELYGLEIPKKNLDLFIVLVLRMIWLGIWYKLNGELIIEDRDQVKNQLIKVYKIICTGNYGYPPGNNANVELNKICLTISDIQQMKMLPDEREWLVRNKIIG
jgi:CheY-like chemotaxis protein